MDGGGGAWLPDVIGAAGRFAVAGFPGALGGGPGPVGEQLVPQVAGETSGAVWWRGRERKPEEPSVCGGGRGVTVSSEAGVGHWAAEGHAPLHRMRRQQPRTERQSSCLCTAEPRC